MAARHPGWWEKDLHPTLVARVHKVIAIMAQSGHPIFVTEGVRTLQRQRELFAIGRTVKGRKVTNADGERAVSNHQVKSDGLAYAVDVAFVGPEPFADDHPWELLGAVVQDCGLSWGGYWRQPDRPHIELLPRNLNDSPTPGVAV